MENGAAGFGRSPSLYDTVNYLGRRPHHRARLQAPGIPLVTIHGCFIYLGRELTDREFNGVIDKALREGEGMFPSVKVVAFSSEAAAAPSITAQQAEEILQRFAPERLKKKPGPKQLVEVD